MSKKPPDFDRRIAELARRKDRFNLPREAWNERDWKVHMHEARKQALAWQSLGTDLPGLTLPPPSFRLFDRPTRSQRVDQVLRDLGR